MYNRTCLLGFAVMSFLAGAFYVGCSVWIYTTAHYHMSVFSVVPAIFAVLAVAFGLAMVYRYRRVSYVS
jgi:apolipoprotein N-acyltransferase